MHLVSSCWFIASNDVFQQMVRLCAPDQFWSLIQFIFPEINNLFPTILGCEHTNLVTSDMQTSKFDFLTNYTEPILLKRVKTSC